MQAWTPDGAADETSVAEDLKESNEEGEDLTPHRIKAVLYCERFC